MKQKLFICLATIVAVNYACSPKYEKEGVIIDGDKAIDVQFEDVATNVSVFPLVGDNPIEDFVKVEMYGNEMLGMNSTQQRVYYFKNNVLEGVLNAVGRGRGEYMTLGEMLYDQDQHILYVTHLNDRTEILKYSVPDMKYIGTLHAPLSIGSMRLYDSKTFLISTKDEQQQCGIFLFDIVSEKILQEVCELTSYQYEQSLNVLSSFNKKNHLISLFGTTNRLCNFSYNSDSLEILFSFNYGATAADYVYQAPTKSAQDANKLARYLNENAGTYANFYFPRKLKNGVSFWYSTLQRRKKNYRYYRIEKDTEINYKGFHIKGLNTLIYPSCICEQGYATIIQGPVDKIMVPEEEESPLAKKILETMNSQNDSNPIIVYYDIK